MLLPRQQHPSDNKISIKKFNDSGFDIKPIYKKMAQHNHINKLLSTAAAGNGVIGDVDALLTPINDKRSENQELQNNSSSKERTERNLWRNDEVMEMLYVMQQVKALDKLNDKTVKSENVFKDVELIMHKNGYQKKSHVQIWTKWKFLKSTYMTSRRNGIVPRMIPQEIFEVLHQMITNHNQGLSECGNSTTGSMEGDSSNAGGMMIGAVDSGLAISSTVNPDEDDSFGMAHPIFGFRLGLVKNEPVDTGYDTIENNEPASVVDPIETKSEKSSKRDKQNMPKENQVKKKLEIPHRGRGRPPKNPPAATLTSNKTASSSATHPNQMPPLRVAPFAKATNTANALAASRPPPPLTMPPTPQPIRVTNICNLSDTMKNDDAVKFPQPKLLPKPLANQTHSPQPIRLLKEISFQPSRTSSTPSPSYPKLKQVPMRKTPYSLRPDRVIPDLDESFSPPHAAVSDKSKRIEEVPSTSHLVMQSNANAFQNGINRKRRPDWHTNTAPTKLKRFLSDDEDTPADQGQDQSRKEENSYGKLLQSVIVDLSTTLRKVQTQMMKDFFNKQHELLQKEHEFQMQQDRLIMETFQVQTYEIMKSVKDLVGTIAVGRREEERIFTTAKESKKGQKAHNGHKQRRIFDQKELQKLQQHNIQQSIAEEIDHEYNVQHQNEHEADEVYSDEDEVQEQNFDHEVNGQENGHIDEGGGESHAGNQDQDDQSHLQQQQHDDQSQSLDEQQVGADDDGDDDEDDDEDDDDDDDDDDDEDDESDSDDDDDNEEMVNGNTSGSLHMVSAELMEDN